MLSSLRSTAPGDTELVAFYNARQGRALWVTDSRLRPEAARVVQIVSAAADDGLDPARYGAPALAEAVRDAAGGTAPALARAEVMLSRSFAAYVRDLRSPTDVGMIYVDEDLAPGIAPTERAVMASLAGAPSLSSGIAAATRMNSLYVRMREAFAAGRAGASSAQQRQFRANLERARALPVDLGERYVLVDAASARLWMYEDGAVQGSMRVVVGKASEPTPMMAGYIRHATLNPYWNVPPDLVQRRIAPNVVAGGSAYLRNAGYEVLSDWSQGARPVDPREVDWTAMASGAQELPVRQLPGPTNAMGRVKFMFPNAQGIYLHDTPNRDLFSADDRRQSAGCVRVEDADRLAQFLFGRSMRATSNAPEQNASLAAPVPVYITYLTAAPEGSRIAYHADEYGRDRPLLARLVGGTYASAR